MASKMVKAELHAFPHSGHSVTAVSPEMLMPWFVRIDASQLDNWHSVFQSVKEVLVPSFEIWTFEGVRKMGSLKPQSETQN
jgi:hypothetical protein